MKTSRKQIVLLPQKLSENFSLTPVQRCETIKKQKRTHNPTGGLGACLISRKSMGSIPWRPTFRPDGQTGKVAGFKLRSFVGSTPTRGMQVAGRKLS